MDGVNEPMRELDGLRMLDGLRTLVEGVGIVQLDGGRPSMTVTVLETVSIGSTSSDVAGLDEAAAEVGGVWVTVMVVPGPATSTMETTVVGTTCVTV